MQSEMLALWILGFIIAPIAVETSVCISPSPDKEGAVCNWKSKSWERKFDLKTREYYYTLKPTSESDNFIEKKMRKRYIERLKYGR